jgi:hypothetical protein
MPWWDSRRTVHTVAGLKSPETGVARAEDIIRNSEAHLIGWVFLTLAKTKRTEVNLIESGYDVCNFCDCHCCVDVPLVLGGGTKMHLEQKLGSGGCEPGWIPIFL